MSVVDLIRERQKARKKELGSSQILDQILGMKLSELGRLDVSLRIYSEILGTEIWLCGNEEMATQVRQDYPETTVYTANEMEKLLSLDPTREGIKRIHIAKSVFNRSMILETKLTPVDEDLNNHD